MSGREIVVTVEIPAHIPQPEIWDMEGELKQIKGVAVDLREAKSLASVTTMIIQIFTDGSQMLGGVVGAATAARDVIKVVHKFMHAKDKEKEEKAEKEGKQNGSKSKVVIVKKGKRIELYNLSVAEIEQILDDE